MGERAGKKPPRMASEKTRKTTRSRKKMAHQAKPLSNPLTRRTSVKGSDRWRWSRKMASGKMTTMRSSASYA